MIKSHVSRINIPLLILFFISIFAIVATKAYFTASADSPENIFTSGTLDLSIVQDSVLTVTNWKPGEEYTLEFNVENTGSLPIYLKGFLGGNWSNEALDKNVFKIVSLSQMIDGNWVNLTQNGVQIDEEFFVSADGTENTLLNLNPGEVKGLRVVVKLSENVSDEYQNQSFSTSLHMAGKQVSNGTSWPLTY